MLIVTVIVWKWHRHPEPKWYRLREIVLNDGEYKLTPKRMYIISGVLKGRVFELSSGEQITKRYPGSRYKETLETDLTLT